MVPPPASPGGRSLEHPGINRPVLPGSGAVAPDEPGFCCVFHNCAELALARANPSFSKQIAEANTIKARQLHRSHYSKMLLTAGDVVPKHDGSLSLFVQREAQQGKGRDKRSGGSPVSSSLL